MNDFLNAETAAKALLKACAETPTAKCDKGLIITFPAGYSAGSDRVKAFKKVVDGKLTVIQEHDAGFMAQEGYKTASQIIPAHKNEISWVYTENDFLAEGVIQALKENGLHPGKDVLVVGGTCHGDTTNPLNKEIIGTGIQAAFLEGWSSVQSTHKYLQSKKVAEGKISARRPKHGAAGRRRSPSLQLHTNPWVGNTQADLDNFKLWGHTFKELCNYWPLKNARPRGFFPRSYFPHRNMIHAVRRYCVANERHFEALRLAVGLAGRRFRVGPGRGDGAAWRKWSRQEHAGEDTRWPRARDTGAVEIEGQPIRLRSPNDSLQAGVAYVTQELSIVGPLSVAENICLGGRGQEVVWTSARLAEQVKPFLALVGLELIDPSCPSGQPVS